MDKSLTRVSSCGPQVSSCQFLAVKAVSFWAFSLLFLGIVMSNFENFDLIINDGGFR